MSSNTSSPGRRVFSFNFGPGAYRIRDRRRSKRPGLFPRHWVRSDEGCARLSPGAIKTKQRMNKTRTVRLIKRQERVSRRPRKKVELAVGPNKWSKSVRSWVVENQNRDRTESLPTF